MSIAGVVLAVAAQRIAIHRCSLEGARPEALRASVGTHAPREYGNLLDRQFIVGVVFLQLAAVSLLIKLK